MTDPAARRFFDSSDPARWGRTEMPDEVQLTREWVERTNVTGPSLELGCGTGLLAGAAPGYAGVDLAFTPLLRMTGNRVEADIEELPFRSASIGFAFSWAALEHVPHPEAVLAEVERVLRPGGVALLAPAWHCRPWAAEGLEFLPYDQLTLSQRARKALIPLRNALAWRALFELPRRVWRELRRTRRFEYQRLRPNLDEYVGTDCDAFTSMDPHAAAIYFAVRGWEVLSHPGLRDRMLARHGAVVVRKPA
jgi:SAM-dependent methyltransferase